MEKRKIPLNRFKLSPYEKRISDALNRGEYRPASKKLFKQVVAAIERRKKDAVLNIRINSQDLARLKAKAKSLGIPYQTMVSELLHRYAA